MPWQTNLLEAAEGGSLGMAQAPYCPMVAVEIEQAVPVMEPRVLKARRFCIRREVELAKFNFSDDCEEAKQHSE